MLRVLTSTVLLLLCVSICLAQIAARANAVSKPAVGRTQIALFYAGSIWVVIAMAGRRSD